MAYDKQLAFNESYLGLKAQNFEKCVDPENKICQYYSDGKNCAVGKLIPPDEYYETMEGAGGIRRNYEVQSVLGVTGDEDAIDFLADLQEAHDGADRTLRDEMPRRLRNVARKYNLTVPE